MQQFAKAMCGPHGQQLSTATKVVYITCVPMCFADDANNCNDPFKRWEQQKHLRCCGAGKNLPRKDLGKKIVGKYLG